MNKTQKKYAPAYEPAYQPPQQTVIVQNVHFGPRPVSKIEQKECRWLTLWVFFYRYLMLVLSVSDDHNLSPMSKSNCDQDWVGAKRYRMDFRIGPLLHVSFPKFLFEIMYIFDPIWKYLNFLRNLCKYDFNPNVILFFSYSCWPLSCVPCCIDSLQDVTHKCPNCKKTIGTYKA